MKKVFLALALLLFLLLSLLYLAVNSPYVIDKLARKYAPQYGFDYDLITGNPLQGIILKDLSYKGEELARTIRIRINPYTLLEKRFTISRLQLIDVNTTVLEKVITDFSTPGADDNASESSGGGLPVSVEVQDTRLTLLPFRRYGIHVAKEELSVDSIYYDDDRFNVGRLRQLAETSVGNIELEGTYHKRFLDVELLAIDHLNLTELEKSIRLIAAEDSGNAPAQEATAAKETAREAPAAGRGEDPFLPRRIRAKRLWVTLLPYRVTKGLELEWAQLDGREIDLDLERTELLGGLLSANLQSNITESRLRLKLGKDRVTLEEGVLSRLDLDAVLALAGSGEEKGKATESPEANASAREPYDALPFVPRYVDVRQLRVELKPGSYDGVEYGDAVASVRDLHLDLHEEKVTAEKLQAYLDTPLAHADLESSIGSDAIRIRSLQLRDVDLDKILAWQKSHSAESNGTKEAQSTPPPKEAKGKGTVKGLELPFVPSVIDLDEAQITLLPWHIDAVDLNRSRLSLRKVRLDLTKMLADGGSLSLDLRSNLAIAELEGKIRKNHLRIPRSEKNRILLPKSLYETYKLPLRPEALSPISVEGEAGEEGAELRLSFHGRRLLADENGSFNIDIDRSVTTLRYDLADANYSVVSETNLSTPQAPSLRLHASLQGRGAELRYAGALESGGVKLGDEKIEKMLGKPRIDFKGDLHSVKADLDAGLFAGRFLSPDFKKGLLSLGTKKRLRPARYFKLPRELAKAWVTLQVEAPIDFASPLPLDANLSLRSNLADLQGTVDYDGNLTAKIVTHFPKDSLLKKMVPALNLKALSPLKLTVEQRGEEWQAKIASREIKGGVLYALDSDTLKGTLEVAGSRIDIEGKPSETIVATLQARSLKGMLNRIRSIYKVELPKFDGDVLLRLRIEKLAKASLELQSKEFVPDDSARIKSPIKNLSVLLSADLKKKNLILQRYSLESAGMKLFATRPSIVHLEGQKIVLQELWLNDSLKATGSYDLKSKKGSFKAKADRFHVQHENADLYAAVNIDAKVTGEQVEAKGKIVLLGGNVMYNIQAKHYATDEDIVILQHRKKNEESFFTKNVQLMLYIETKKPLLFKQKDVYVELKPQLSILKSFHGDLQLLGSVQLAKGGYYIFEGKKFVLSPSSINFTGKPSQPLLDINLVYRRYSRTVYITVNGVATEPNINFSSDPFMTRSQILSFIMFDTVDSGENAGDMLSMVGGGMAKSILNNIGLKVDTMVVTTDGFEVGKKITDKITLIYDQKEENPRAILRIQNSKRTETDISIGSESQSVDIIYKREF